MAQEFVNSKIHPGKVVVFIKPTCPYCRQTQELLSQFSFRQGALEFVDITATGDSDKIQDYLQQLTGARTLPPRGRTNPRIVCSVVPNSDAFILKEMENLEARVAYPGTALGAVCVVPRVFIGKECIGGCTDLTNMHQRGELLTRLKQIGALQ